MSGRDYWQPACSLDALRARGALLAQLREFLWQRDVLEVQTPCLASSTVTDPQIDAIPVPGFGYLQTSPEYLLKRLLAAGAPSIYQIGPAFRADESGRLHNAEFTLLEWYRLGYDDAALMDEVAELVDRVLGPADYRRVSYADVLARAPDAQGDLAFVQGLDTFRNVRVFVTSFPVAQAALARVRGTPPTAARFELVIDGVEIANGYYEQGDAATLQARFAADLAERRRLNRKRVDVDDKFLAAMRAGMPDCAGVAVGVDRLLMLKLGVDSLAEVMAFPMGVA